MTDTTAKIAAKGTQNTGITEELARRCYDQLGRKVLAVVELVAETRSETKDGAQKVGLSILTIEPAPNADTEEHLRNLARSFHYERRLTSEDQQLRIDTADDLEPKVADVLAAGQQHIRTTDDELDYDDGGQDDEDQDEDDDEDEDGPDPVATIPSPFTIPATPPGDDAA